MQVLRFASIYKAAAMSASTHANLHRWAAGIARQAFVQVMGRAPTRAELQIVLAVSDIESNYGRGWKEGKGEGSHNWGAVQTRSKKNSFRHQDSSAQGKYITNFKAYPDDIAGAADVVRNLFKSSLKQRMPDPQNKNRAMGPSITNGPSRSELIEAAAQIGDTDAFSRAMWYTNYFEGVAPDFAERIRVHAGGIQNAVNSIASALREPAAWSRQSTNNSAPVTTDISNQTRNINAPIAQKPPQAFNELFKQKQDDGAYLENLLWQ